MGLIGLQRYALFAEEKELMSEKQSRHCPSSSDSSSSGSPTSSSFSRHLQGQKKLTSSNGLLPNSDGFQPTSHGLQPTSLASNLRAKTEGNLRCVKMTSPQNHVSPVLNASDTML